MSSIADVCAKFPGLGYYGLDVVNNSSLGSQTFHEFQLAVQYLNHHRAKAGQTSYGIKHVVEESTGEYIGNGSMIAALYVSGYKLKPAPPNVVVQGKRLCK